MRRELNHTLFVFAFMSVKSRERSFSKRDEGEMSYEENAVISEHVSYLVFEV